jgi:hypothetical protein
MRGKHPLVTALTTIIDYVSAKGPLHPGKYSAASLLLIGVLVSLHYRNLFRETASEFGAKGRVPRKMRTNAARAG